jgi:hypothetical protein
MIGAGGLIKKLHRLALIDFLFCVDALPKLGLIIDV